MAGPEGPALEERVARRKFRQAELLYENRNLFEARGWEIAEPRFPSLSVFFKREGVSLCGVRLELRDYDFSPPSVVLIGANGRPLTALQLRAMLAPFQRSHVPPSAMQLALPGDANDYIPGGHPITGLPFICIWGTAELHSHPQHANILWEWLRADPAYGLQRLVEAGREAYRDELFR